MLALIPPGPRTEDGADIYAYYIAKSFFNAAAAKSIDSATMQAIISWNTKFLDTQDEGKQWTDRKALWATFVAAMDTK